MEVFDKQKPLISEEYAPPTRRKAVSVGSNTRNHIFGYLESDNKKSNFSFFVKFLPSKFCSTNIESFPLKNIRNDSIANTPVKIRKVTTYASK